MSGPTRSPEKTSRRAGLAALLHVEDDDGRAQDVPGVEERGPDAWRDLAWAVVLDGPEEGRGRRDVVLVIEWLQVLGDDGGRLGPQVRLMVDGSLG